MTSSYSIQLRTASPRIDKLPFLLFLSLLGACSLNMAGKYIAIDTVARNLASLQCENTDELYGLVDMGSNGIRFSITDLRPPSARLFIPVFHERAPISLYDALHASESDEKQFYFSKNTIKNVSETLGRFKKIGIAYGVPEVHFVIFATEAFRTAKNQDEMAEAILKSTGLTVYILSREVETLFGAMGVRSGFTGVDGLIMDLGGGSLQVTYVNTLIGSNYETLAAKAGHSLPFGAARLIAELNNPNTAQATINELQVKMKSTVQSLQSTFTQLNDQINSADGVNIYLCGGGFRGYGSMLMHTDPVQPYPIPYIGGYGVPGSRFKEWKNMLIANEQEGDIYGLSKRRRHQFPAIAMVVQAITLAIPRIKSVIFCTGGNREGLLFMMLPSYIREMDPFPLVPIPNPEQDSQVISHVTNLLMNILPKKHILPPYVFNRKVISYISSHIWAFQGLTGNATRALHKSLDEVRNILPSLPHFLSAVIALTLSARWGDDIGPIDINFAANLQKVVGLETVWWCRYMGTACHFISMIFPVFPRNLESFSNALNWKVVTSDTLGKKKNKKGILLQIRLMSGLEQGIPGGLDSHMLKMWKKIGKGLRLGRKVQVEIELVK
ncbi:Retrograde regulation protein 2 [Erysiphe necator]|nr:Retrograde regulation protein 2 [Erysiphe necator]